MQPTKLLSILTVFICFFLTGCIPIKVATRVKPVTGATLESEPDTSVIRVGVTTRTEITQQFGTFDIGWKGDRLFLGRWLRSGVGVAPMPRTDRSWAGHELVVEFDEKGTVSRYQVLSNKEFLDELPGLLPKGGDLSEFQQPTGDTTFKIVNVAGKEFLDLSGFDTVIGHRSWRSRITREQIERLSTASRWESELSAGKFDLTIHLRDKVEQETQVSSGRRGKRSTNTLRFRDDVLTIVQLVQFLQIPRPKD